MVLNAGIRRACSVKGKERRRQYWRYGGDGVAERKGRTCGEGLFPFVSTCFDLVWYALAWWESDSVFFLVQDQEQG